MNTFVYFLLNWPTEKTYYKYTKGRPNQAKSEKYSKPVKSDILVVKLSDSKNICFEGEEEFGYLYSKCFYSFRFYLR